MGMAASQARFLSLTARKTNVEYEGQQVNQQRTALANESANLYNKLNSLSVPTPPAVSDYTEVTYTFEANDIDTSSTRTSTNYTLRNIYSTPAGNYATLEWTTYSWDSAVTNAYTGTFSRNSKGELQKITLDNGLSCTAAEYFAKPANAGFEFQSSDIQDGTVAIAGINFKVDLSDNQAEVGSDTYEIKSLGDNKYQIVVANSLKETTEGSEKKYSFSCGGKTFNVIVNEDGSYTVKDSEGKAVPNAKAGAIYTTSDGNTTFQNTYFGDSFTTVTNSGVSQYNQPIIAYSYLDQTYYISATESQNSRFYDSYYIHEKPTLRQQDYPCAYDTASNGRYKTVTIQTSPDKDAVTYPLNVSNVQDEAEYNQAMLDYEYEQAKYEKAIKDINAKTEKIQQQDKTLELRLKQLDTEQNALKTEMESVSKVIEDNISSTFKTFA